MVHGKGLNDNKPFISDFGAKPDGANFYPADITKEEFEAWENDPKKQVCIRLSEETMKET